MNLDATAATGATDIWDAVCVKECPMKGVQTQCIKNSDSGSTCPTAQLDTSANHFYCLPTGESAGDALAGLYAKGSGANDLGKYMADL